MAITNRTGCMIVTLLLCVAAALAKTSARRDRPVRAAGHTLTTHLLEEWAPSSDIRVARREGHDRHANNHQHPPGPV
jgi:hypothetical protein